MSRIGNHKVGDRVYLGDMNDCVGTVVGIDDDGYTVEIGVYSSKRTVHTNHVLTYTEKSDEDAESNFNNHKDDMVRVINDILHRYMPGRSVSVVDGMIVDNNDIVCIIPVVIRGRCIVSVNEQCGYEVSEFVYEHQTWDEPENRDCVVITNTIFEDVAIRSLVNVLFNDDLDNRFFDMNKYKGESTWM